jgi:hypothetical protein
MAARMIWDKTTIIALSLSRSPLVFMAGSLTGTVELSNSRCPCLLWVIPVLTSISLL